MMARRERTRDLIELGGLVVKSGLATALDDDRAAILGALIEQVARLQDEEAAQVKLLWIRRGRRAFNQDRLE